MADTKNLPKPNEKVGGYLVSKEGGKTIVHNNGDDGGLLIGKRHSEGGIKAVNTSNNQPVEMETMEVVLTPAISNSTKTYEIDGKKLSAKEAASYINHEIGGGVKFKSGGEIGEIKCIGKEYKFGGKVMTDTQIAAAISKDNIVNKSDGKPLSVSGGTVIITRPAVMSEELISFNGKQEKIIDVLSKINVDAGGKPFNIDKLKNGGEIDIHTCGKQYEYGGETMSDIDIVSSCGCKHSKMDDGGSVPSVIPSVSSDNTSGAIGLIEKHPELAELAMMEKGGSVSEEEVTALYMDLITKLWDSFDEEERMNLIEGWNIQTGKDFKPEEFSKLPIVVQGQLYKSFRKAGERITDTDKEEIMDAVEKNEKKYLIGKVFEFVDKEDIEHTIRILNIVDDDMVLYLNDGRKRGMPLLEFKEWMLEKGVDIFMKRKNSTTLCAIYDTDSYPNAKERAEKRAAEIREEFPETDIYVEEVPYDGFTSYRVQQKFEGRYAAGGTVDESAMKEVNEFAKMFQDKVDAHYLKESPSLMPPIAKERYKTVKVIPKSKYILIDLGDSAKFMYEKASGILYGTKGYMVVNKGHNFGLLSDIIKNDFDFNGYYIQTKGTARKGASPYAGSIMPSDVAAPADTRDKGVDEFMSAVPMKPIKELSDLTKSRSAVIPMREEEKPPRKLRLNDIPDSVKTFMPLMQQKAIVGSEEHWDTMKELLDIIEKMPKSYETEDIASKDKIVYLHYFYGSSDWYIVEKDSEPQQYQAYGYVILNGDTEMAEWGYVDIEALKKTNKVELDFHFTPIKFGELMANKKQMDGENEREEQGEREYEETAEKEFVAADKSIPANPKLKSVTIDFTEGNFSNKLPQSFTSFRQMTKWLRDNMTLRGADEGYDKTGTVIEWADGEKQREQYDISIKETNPFRQDNIWALQSLEDVIYSLMGDTPASPESAKRYDDTLSELGQDGMELTNEQFNSMVQGILGRYMTYKHLDFKKDYGTIENALKVLKGKLPKTFAVFTTSSTAEESGKTFADKIIPAIKNRLEYRKEEFGEDVEFDQMINKEAYVIIQYKGVSFFVEDNKKSYRISTNDGNAVASITDVGSISELAGFIIDNIVTTVDNNSSQNKSNSTFGIFNYGKKWDVPASNSSELITSLKKLGFIIVEEHKSSIDIKKDGYGTIYVNDNGGEFNLGERENVQTHISNVPYSINTGNRKPNSLAVDINEDYDNYYNISDPATEEKTVVSAPELITEKTVTATTLVVNANDKITSKKQYEINNAVKDLIKEKGSDRSKYSADELALLKLWSGSGSLAKQGAKGTGLLDQFFTPADIVAKMWGLALKHGFSFNGANILEPAVGVGKFLANIPKDVPCNVVGYDIDETAVIICKVLYPEYDIRHASFETMFFTGRRHIGLAGLKQPFDLVITNPPYRPYVSEYSPLGEKEATGAETMEMYFIMRGVDVLKKGGLLIMIVPNTFMSNKEKYNDFKEKLAKKADLIDGYRLPNGVFSNTDVGTDILVLRKKGEEKKIEEPVVEREPLNISAPITKTTKKKVWGGHVPPNDDFGKPITDEFVDGATVTGQFGMMNPESFKKYGTGLGLGKGQRYKKEGNEWVKQPDGSKYESGGEVYILSPELKGQIRESISMGFNILQEGMISPKKRGVMLRNADYQVRGTYPLDMKSAIEDLIKEINPDKNGAEKEEYVKIWSRLKSEPKKWVIERTHTLSYTKNILGTDDYGQEKEIDGRMYAYFDENINPNTGEKFENGGETENTDEIGFYFDSFTLNDLINYLKYNPKLHDVDVSFVALGSSDKYENRIKNFYSDKKLLSKSFSIGKAGKQITVNKGNENLYTDILVYDDSNKEYLIGLYTKDNHDGLKAIVNSIVNHFKHGGKI